MCPPNIADLADRDKLLLMARDVARAAQASVLEVRARWHWWCLERADDQAVSHTRALARVGAQTRALKAAFEAEHADRAGA